MTIPLPSPPTKKDDARSCVGAASAAMGARAMAAMAAACLAWLAPSVQATPAPADTFTLTTASPAETRHISVYTPPGYEASSDRYPVLYVPDGGLEEDFPHVAKAVDEGIRAGEIAPILVVGIENTERRRDMTGPTTVASDKAIAPRVGGSAAFRHFIATQLIPEIGKRYRVSPRRGIIGESLAGLFVTETFLREPGLFDTFIAISPSLWWNDGALLRDASSLLKSQPENDRFLFLTSADEDNIAPNVAKLANILQASASKHLDWLYVPRPEQHHDTIYLASERYALRRAFPPATPVPPKTAAARRVLFVGNSLTYVNNLPGAFASLAPPDRSIDVDMLARGGAALADYEHDPVFASAIANGRYTDVVFQERGGDAFCGPGCDGHLSEETERSSVAVARNARAAGARIHYLGTWQTSAETDAALEKGEHRIVALMEASYIEVASTRLGLMQQAPGLPWVHADGQHPGFATTALLALRTWRSVMGQVSDRTPCVAGPLYDHSPKPQGILTVDRTSTPVTCLVSPGVAAKLAGLP